MYLIWFNLQNFDYPTVYHKFICCINQGIPVGYKFIFSYEFLVTVRQPVFLNFNRHTNHLGILLNYKLWLNRSIVTPKMLQSLETLKWHRCSSLPTTLISNSLDCTEIQKVSHSAIQNMASRPATMVYCSTAEWFLKSVLIRKLYSTACYTDLTNGFSSLSLINITWR